MTRRIGFDEAPAAAREDYRRYLNTYLGLTGTSWGAWWARYGAEYSTGDAGGEVAAGEPVPGGTRSRVPLLCRSFRGARLVPPP